MPERIDSDLLSRILSQYQFNARVFASPRVCGAWQINTTGLHQAGFHLMVQGACWLHAEALENPVALNSGDLVFLARETRHLLSPQQNPVDSAMRLVNEGGGEITEIICGAVEFGHTDANALLDTLPAVLVLQADNANQQAQIAAMATLLGQELDQRQAGFGALLDRLAQMLVIVVLRHAMATGLVTGGLLSGIRDPRLREPLRLIHEQWQSYWSLEALAEKAGLSRSAFARLFAQVIGNTPKQYQDAWRLWQAELMLKDRKHSVAQVAEQLGYASEAAFRRAFSRVRGQPPGLVRRLTNRTDLATVGVQF